MTRTGSYAPAALPIDSTADALGRRRALRVLWTAGVLGGFAQSLTGIASTLLARRLGGSDWAAGLPQGLLVLGSAAAAAVLSRVMSRRGRRAGLVTGGVVATLGCVAGVAAAGLGSLLVLCGGSLLMGWGTCAVMFARYAAADRALPGDRARALASVLAAICIGAVAGPNLLAMTARLDRSGLVPDGAGAYVVGAVVFAAATAVWAHGLRAEAPTAPLAPGPGADPSTVPRVATRSSTAVGIGVLALANLVMVAAMTMAPVQMQMGDGSGLGAIGLVVSLHIAAMFAPSPLTGRLVDRVGERTTALLACGLLTTATTAAALAGESAAALAAAMIVLGLGWNVATVAGSSMLTRDVPAPRRARLEGRGEVGMGLAAAVGGGCSGLLVSGAGYSFLALAALLVVLAGLLPITLRHP